ncbi:MAG TPA: MFS transporter [Planctomycetes bacterium]|nr:MFS transporter [Planctomycetota bacterium]
MAITERLQTGPTDSHTIYDQVFWLCYLVNFSLVAANTLTFRFAEFVRLLGGTERVTGTIVGIGLAATLLVRFRLGSDIDRFGTRRLWLASAVLFVSGSVLLALARSLSWQIYLARGLFSVGVAGMFTCVMVFIQDHVPPERRTEAIGNLGSSGFLGMIVGSLLSDWILSALPAGRLQFEILFGSTAALGVVCAVLVAVVTRRDGSPPQRITPPFHRLVLAYWPGSVVLAAMMIGVGVTVTTVFLTRFCTARNLGGIGLFFSGYSVSAFVFRILTRRWSHTVGRHRMILYGLAGHASGHLLLILARAPWQLVVPSIACGFGHALLFPAVVSLGAGKFPRPYRGTGTNVMIGFIEIGLVLASPSLGWIIDAYGFEIMLGTTAALAVVTGLVYRVTGARSCDREGEDEERGRPWTGPSAPSRADTPPQPAAPADGPRAAPDEDDLQTPFPYTGRTA